MGIKVHHDCSWVLEKWLISHRVIFSIRRAPQCVNGLRKHHHWAGFVGGRKIGEKLGCPAFDTEIERCAWFWNHINKKAMTEHDNLFVSRLEYDDKALALDWLGLAPKREFPNVIMGQQGMCPEGFDKLKRVVLKHCSETMDYFYPGWQDSPDAWLIRTKKEEDDDTPTDDA